MIYLILFFLLVVLMAAIDVKRGIRSVFVLILNTALVVLSVVFFGLGFPVLPTGLLAAVCFLLITLFFQNGVSQKTVASLLSVFIVLCAVGGIIYAVTASAHITGLNEIDLEEGNNFMGYAIPIKLRDVLILSMLWAEIGAVTDTALSVSSAMNEIDFSGNNLTYQKLFTRGMSVGKDILGTTVNTLTFIALGEGLMLFFYYLSNGYGFSDILNAKSFFQSLSCVIFSCIGCVFVIPVDAAVFAFMKKGIKGREKSAKSPKERKPNGTV